MRSLARSLCGLSLLLFLLHDRSFGADNDRLIDDMHLGMNQNDWPRVIRALDAGAKILEDTDEQIFQNVIQKAVGEFWKPGMSNVVSQLIQHGLSLDDTDQDSSVLWSVFYNSKGEFLALWLLDNGAGKKLTVTGKTRLFAEAVRSGYSNAVARLITMGVPANADLGNGANALTELIRSDRWPADHEKEMAGLARFLIAKGADPSKRGPEGKSLAEIALNEGRAEIALALSPNLRGSPELKQALRSGAQKRLWTAIGQRTMKLMHSSDGPPGAQVDVMALIRSSLAEGADPNEPRIPEDVRSLGTTPFGYALGMGSSDYYWRPMPQDPEVVRELIRGGANVSESLPNNGPPPLVVAETAPKIFDMLLQAGADPRKIFRLRRVYLADRARGFQERVEEMSVLHHVSAYGSQDSLKLLLAQRLVLEEKDFEGFTPLLRAVESGNAPNIDLLLKAGASTAAKTASGESFEDMAGKSMLVGVLRQQGMTTRYQDLLKEFPVQPTSKFVGRWGTGQPATNEVLVLRPEGSGTLRCLYWNYEKAIAWKATGDTVECHAFGHVNLRELLPAQRLNGTFTYNSRTDVLTHKGNLFFGGEPVDSELKRIP